MPKGKSKTADDELELIGEDETPKTKAKSGKASAKSAVEEKPVKKRDTNPGMGAAWLAEYVNEELGTEYTAANIRVILRKMASEGDLERNVGEDRARYQFTGENDKIVKAVLKRIKSGELEVEKKKSLENAKASKAAKADAKPKKSKADDTDEITDEPKRSPRRKRAAE